MEEDAWQLPLKGFGAELARRLYGSRTIIAYGEVDDAFAAQITGELAALASESDSDVRVLMSAWGEDLTPALAVHDMIRAAGPRVQVIGVGQIAGTGILAFAAAPREDRVCLPNAQFHLSESGTRTGGPSRSAEHEAAEKVRRLEHARRILAAQTGQPLRQIEEDLRRGRWLDAEEAATYGLVARVVTREQMRPPAG